MRHRRRIRLRGLALRNALAALAMLAAAAGAMALLDSTPDSQARAATALPARATLAPPILAATDSPAFAVAELPIAPAPLRPDPSLPDLFPSRGRVALLGSVTDDLGRPLAGACVTVDGTQRICDEQGGFELRSLRIPANRCGIEIEIRAPGFAVWSYLRMTTALPSPEAILPGEVVRMVPAVQAGETLSERIALPRPARLGGIVRDSRGRPVPDAMVQGRCVESGRTLEHGPLACRDGSEFETRTSEDGRYEVGVTTPGFWILDVTSTRTVGRRLSVKVEPGALREAPELVLDEPGHLRGRVLDVAGETVGAGFLVICWPDPGPPSSSPPLRHGFDGSTQPLEGSLNQDITADDGSFRLEGLDPGDWLVAVVPGAQDPVWPGVSAARIEAGEEAAVELRLTLARHLSGVVVDREGRPAAGLRITAREIGRSARRDWQAQTVSDERGAFTVDVAPDGLVQLTATGADGTDSVDVEPHVLTEQRLELHPFSGGFTCGFSAPTQP
jgi:hypothetical protein